MSFPFAQFFTCSNPSTPISVHSPWQDQFQAFPQVSPNHSHSPQSYMSITPPLYQNDQISPLVSIAFEEFPPMPELVPVFPAPQPSYPPVIQFEEAPPPGTIMFRNSNPSDYQEMEQQQQQQQQRSNSSSSSKKKPTSRKVSNTSDRRSTASPVSAPASLSRPARTRAQYRPYERPASSASSSTRGRSVSISGQFAHPFAHTVSGPSSLRRQSGESEIEEDSLDERASRVQQTSFERPLGELLPVQHDTPTSVIASPVLPTIENVPNDDDGVLETDNTAADQPTTASSDKGKERASIDLSASTHDVQIQTTPVLIVPDGSPLYKLRRDLYMDAENHQLLVDFEFPRNWNRESLRQHLGEPVDGIRHYTISVECQKGFNGPRTHSNRRIGKYYDQIPLGSHITPEDISCEVVDGHVSLKISNCFFRNKSTQQKQQHQQGHQSVTPDEV